MTPELPDDIELGYSAAHWLPLIGLGAAMTLLSAGIAFELIVEGIGPLHRAAGWFGLAFFALVTAKFVRALLKTRGPVLFVSRYGIRDLRIANEFILWDSVTAVSAGEANGRRLVVLKITPALEQRVFCSGAAQAILAANRARGVDGIAISPAGLSVDFDTLLQACSSHFAAARRSGGWCAIEPCDARPPAPGEMLAGAGAQGRR